MTILASCANCASWRADACARGLAPPAGEPRCADYAISDTFASQLAGVFLKENPLRMPVALRPLSNAERRKLARRPQPRSRKGFRG